jgi:hypothetical protein
MAFIGIDRDIRNHWIYKDPEYFKVWFEMLCCARYAREPKTDFQDGEVYTLNYGEFMFGRIKWSGRLNVGEQRIRTLIKKLIKEEMIELVSKHRYFSIYKVINYEKFNHQNNQQETHTGQGIQGDDNQQTNHLLTTCQPSANHLLTTKEQSNNKDNNVNKDIKDIYDFWNSLEIIKHRELTQKMKSSINARLENMTVDEMREAIGNYNTIITSELYWYTYKFTLDKFMNPKNIDQFLTENKPFETFRKQKGGGNGGKSGRYDARNAEANRKDANKNEELFIGKFGHNTVENPEEFDRMLRNFE